MKKSTLSAVFTALKGIDFDPDMLAEIEKELNKDKAQKDATQAVYAEIRTAVMEVLKSATDPVTAQELADETGYPKGKIVYGLSHYWGEEIEKIEGKVNSYTLKV